VPDTIYAMYAASVHRAALWAPYNTLHATGVAKAMLVSRNLLFRYPAQVAHRVSTPLRQWTVAMGAPLLFQKHALTDTFRTSVEQGPFSILEAFGLRPLTVRGKTIVPEIRSVWKRRMDGIMEGLPPETVTYIRYRKAVAHNSEAQWLSGNRQVTYKPKTIWDDKGRLRNLDESADALVRLTQGKAFAAWARGGDDAVRTWLATAEGKQFLIDGSWYGLHKYLNDELNTALRKTAKLPERQFQASVIEEFMDTIVRQEWARLETALPDIMPTLKAMATNDQLISLNGVKKLIADNPTNNAVLSTPINEWGINSMAGYIVGKAMAPNKWNRDVMFDSVFARQYNRLTKDGMKPKNAYCPRRLRFSCPSLLHKRR
jgi:hypothetical protein